MHDPRILRADLLARHTEPPGGGRSKTLDDDVGSRDQAIERLARFGLAQIERDAPLAAIEQQIVDAATVEQWRQLARRIAAARVFDLDHVRAELREHQRRERTRHEARQVENADAVKWKAHDAVNELCSLIQLLTSDS